MLSVNDLVGKWVYCDDPSVPSTIVYVESVQDESLIYVRIPDTCFSYETSMFHVNLID